MNNDNSQFCVNIYCVMPSNCTEATCPKDLFAAYECCRENSFNVTWLQEKECGLLKPCKEDVFILAEFSGSLFENLRKYKCTIIGPQCLLVSVHKGEPLPEVPSPVFTVAMKGLTITSTGFNAQEKKDIADHVQFMGGIYTSAFHGNVTHLLVKNVAEFSQKYKVAVAKDIPIMTTKWVDAVWSASCKESVHGNDPTFAKFACPPFQGLVVCVSQIAMKDRDSLKKIIESNGGQYSGQLEMGKTNILITPVAEGEKYIYAKRWKIRCIKPDWVYQSIKKGYAVDPDEFIVERSETTPRCSTPEGDHTGMRFGNTSINSTILNESQVQNVNETAGSVTSVFHPPDKTDKSDAIDQIDLGQIRKAGPFLDGCKIFLSGFEGSQMEKLRRIVNGAGVARFNSISESLTHVIVGSRVEDHWKQVEQLLHKPFVVTTEWVIQSYRLKRAAPETDYLHPEFKVADVDLPRPSEKRAAVFENETEEQETQMVQQYLTTDQSKDVSFTNAETTGVFSGLSFRLIGTEPEFEDFMTELIASNGGRLVNASAKYVVVDFGCHTKEPSKEGVIEVNSLWIEDCIDHEELIDIQFFHRPMKPVGGSILAGCVIAQSGIEGRQRTFLSHLVSAMGAVSQDTFARRTIEAKNIFACTHLICPKPEGRKYEAAQSWGVAAVDIKWLLACAMTGSRENESSYPAGSDAPLPQEDRTARVLVPRSSPNVEVQRKEPEPDSQLDDLPLSARIRSGSSSTGTGIAASEPQVDQRNVSIAEHENVPVGAATPLTTQTRGPLFNIPTPQTPYGRLLNTDPSPDTRKIWKHALDNRVRLTPRPLTEILPDESLNSAEADPVDPETQGYFENLRKKFRFDDTVAMKDDEEPCQKSQKPFQGVVIFVNKKLEDQLQELTRAINALGGDIRWQHCKEVTHYIYQGKLAASKELRSVKEWQQKVVAPQWIYDCEDAQIRLDENQYPPSLNPKMAALSISVSGSQQPSGQQSQKRARTQVATPRTEPRNSQRKRLNPLSTPHVPLPVPFDDVDVEPEEVKEPESTEDATRELLQFDQILSKSSESNTKKINSVASRNIHNVFVPFTQPSLPTESSESQSGGVVWDLLEVAKDTPPRYCIMFSTMDQSDRDKYSKIIEALGGKVSTLNYYDSSATHIVVVRPVRNEKLVSTIAAGKWVMCPDWLDASARQNRFVSEEDYEWGSCSELASLQLDAGTQEATVAAAAHRWRIQRSRGESNGPFSGMKAILQVKDRSGAFQRLLEAGGGEVVERAMPSSFDKKINICIVDPKQISSIDVAALAANGIYCVPFVYLNTVLTSIQKPEWKDSVVPEFIPYLNQMPTDM